MRVRVCVCVCVCVCVSVCLSVYVCVDTHCTGLSKQCDTGGLVSELGLQFFHLLRLCLQLQVMSLDSLQLARQLAQFAPTFLRLVSLPNHTHRPHT